MADAKISALVELAATPAANDELAIVDKDAGVTKKIVPANLLGGVDYALVSGNDPATDVTAVQLETLSDGSNADALHVHAAAGVDIPHSDTTGQTTDDHHAESHTIVSHDTTGTGAEVTTLTDGSNADALHVHAQTVELNAFYNGTFVETFRSTVTSAAGVITYTLDQIGGGDLTMIFSDGFTVLDCTPAVTVVLTAGTATVPAKNFIYIPLATKVLTVSVVDWPAGEHIKVAESVVQTAAIVQASGPLVMRQWNDHKAGTDLQGHLSHVAERLRWEHAAWWNGVVQTLTITPGAPDTIHFSSTQGIVYQLHQQVFPAKDSGAGDELLVVNDSVTPYTRVTDLAGLLLDSTGASMSGKYYSLVIWGTVSSNNQNCEYFVNLPSGSYNGEELAVSDPDQTAEYSIPDNYRGYAFLISRLVLKHSAAGGGTWTSVAEIDLRGLTPGIVGGGGGSNTPVNEFPDSLFRVYDDGDVTKLVALQCSGITTATTRTMTVQDASGTIAYLSDLTGLQGTLIINASEGDDPALTGAINGVNAVYLCTRLYVAGSLRVWLNGVRQTKGATQDFQETAPGGGQFTFVIPPLTGFVIICEFEDDGPVP